MAISFLIQDPSLFFIWIRLTDITWMSVAKIQFITVKMNYFFFRFLNSSLNSDLSTVCCLLSCRSEKHNCQSWRKRHSAVWRCWGPTCSGCKLEQNWPGVRLCSSVQGWAVWYRLPVCILYEQSWPEGCGSWRPVLDSEQRDNQRCRNVRVPGCLWRWQWEEKNSNSNQHH